MKIATHNGPFHADEILATALLMHIYPNAKLVRTRDPKVMEECDIVYDIGGEYDVARQRFDHHMPDFDQFHDNGIKLSSLGLLWREYGQEYCNGNKEVADKIYDGFVASIDAPDNGQALYDLNDYEVSPMSIDDLFRTYYPAYGEEGNFDDAFKKALKLAVHLLARVKAQHLGRFASKEKFLQAVADSPSKQYVDLPESMPYGSLVEDLPELLYIIAPRESGDFIVRAVPKAKGSFAVRKKLPSAWAGLNDKDLVEASGVDSAVFCHADRWICSAATKEGALQMVQKSLQQ